MLPEWALRGLLPVVSWPQEHEEGVDRPGNDNEVSNRTTVCVFKLISSNPIRVTHWSLQSKSQREVAEYELYSILDARYSPTHFDRRPNT